MIKCVPIIHTFYTLLLTADLDHYLISLITPRLLDVESW